MSFEPVDCKQKKTCPQFFPSCSCVKPQMWSGANHKHKVRLSALWFPLHAFAVKVTVQSLTRPCSSLPAVPHRRSRKLQTYTVHASNLPLCLHSAESFDIVLRGNGFALGRSNEGVVCSFIVDQQTFSKLSTGWQEPHEAQQSSRRALLAFPVIAELRHNSTPLAEFSFFI